MSALRALDIPQPPEDQIRRSRKLGDWLAQRISARGPIHFREYMEHALYHPDLGYYTSTQSKFGGEGDFVTAPELGSVFASCLGQAIAGVLRELAPASILEIGAGSGAMAADLLLQLAQLDASPEHYWIVERSAACRKQQQQTLRRRAAQHVPRVRWLEQPPADPFDGVILGNEVVDALGCDTFERGADRVYERAVGLDGKQGLCWQLRPADARLTGVVEDIEGHLGARLPREFQSEVQLQLGPWLDQISASLRRGLVLLSDYGYCRAAYYHPTRTHGTLICHYRHRVHDDPFFYPGLQDITASVDFSALAKAGQGCGLDLNAFGSQAGFLLCNGLEGIGQRLAELGPLEAMRLSQEIKLLTLPDEMGERFQMMVLGRGDVPAVAMLADWSRRL